MESSSFQTQMLSIMEVLAQAAAAEIHRRVDDSCALLRLEVSQSRRDIDSLKRKCEVMEAELRRSRLRVRRKGFYPPTRRHQSRIPLIQTEAPTPPEQGEVQVDTAEEVQVKEEGSEEENSQEPTDFASGSFESSSSSFQNSLENPGSLVFLTDEEQQSRSRGDGEVVKQEQVEAPDEIEPRVSSWMSSEQNFSHPPTPACLDEAASQSRMLATQTWMQMDEDAVDQRSAQLQLSGTRPVANTACFSRSRRTGPAWRAHPAERQYSCTFCNRSFARFNQFKEHLRCHTGEKPYSCQQCGRSFTRQFNLIRHAVVHSGEKPFQCSLCGKCFTQRSSLKSHQKNSH